MSTIDDLTREFETIWGIFTKNVLDKHGFRPRREQQSDEQVQTILEYIQDAPSVELAAFRFIAFCRPGQTVELNSTTRVFEHRGAGFNIIYGYDIEDPIAYFADFPVPSGVKERKRLLAKCLSGETHYPDLVAFRTPSEEAAMEAAKSPKPVFKVAKRDPTAAVAPKALTKSFAEIIAKPEDNQVERPPISPAVWLSGARRFISSRRFHPIVLEQFEAINALYFNMEGVKTGIEKTLDNYLVYRLANPVCAEIELLGTKGIAAICAWVISSEDTRAKKFITKSLVSKILQVEPIPPIITLGEIEGCGTNLQHAIHVLQALLTSVKNHPRVESIVANTRLDQVQELYAIVALVQGLYPQ
jgi:hypothetical protein